jgi:hypothetical protein
MVICLIVSYKDGHLAILPSLDIGFRFRAIMFLPLRDYDANQSEKEENDIYLCVQEGTSESVFL